MAYPHSPARRKYTFVGIDPGTTIGVAIIDLEGKPIEVFSSKNYSCSDVVERIIAHGNPLIVASDVTPTPSTVKRISRIFSSPIHELEESLAIEEKIELTKGRGYKYNNAHERDALAACVNAFRRYKKKFSQVHRKTPPDVDVEEVKAMVIKGVSISDAIDRLIRAKEEKEAEKEMKIWGARRKKSGDKQPTKKGSERTDENELRLSRRIMKGKDDKIEMLEELTAALKTKLAEKEGELANLHSQVATLKTVRKREIEKTEEIIRREKEIKRLKEKLKEREGENAELRQIVEELKGKREVKVEGGKKIKVIRSFSRNAILDTDRKYGLKRGDVVFLEDGSGGGASTAELLASKGVAAVIYGKELSHFAAGKFFESGIPAFSTGEIPLLLKEESEGKGRGDFAFVDERLLREKTEEWKKERKRGKRGEKYRTLYFK